MIKVASIQDSGSTFTSWQIIFMTSEDKTDAYLRIRLPWKWSWAPGNAPLILYLKRNNKNYKANGVCLSKWSMLSVCLWVYFFNCTWRGTCVCGGCGCVHAHRERGRKGERNKHLRATFSRYNGNLQSPNMSANCSKQFTCHGVSLVVLSVCTQQLAV